MWGMLVAASLVTFLTLYCPGYLFWRAFRFERLLAFCTAPLASACAFGLIGIAFNRAGVPATAWTVGGALLALSMAAFGASLAGRALSKSGAALAFPRTDGSSEAPRTTSEIALPPRFDWFVLAGYVLCGLVVVSAVYLASIGDPNAFFCRWDNQEHLPLVKAFLDSNSWSSLATSPYLGTSAQAQPYLNEAAEFYPACLHGLIAFSCSATGASVPCGVNAVNTVFAGVVVPVSMFSFIKTVFPTNSAAHIAGSVMTSACTAWPWWFFISGPLYPNFAGMALVPACAGCAIALLKTPPSRLSVSAALALGGCAVVSLALMHPNSLFLLFVVLAPYGASHLWKASGKQDGRRARRGIDARRCGVMALYLAAVIAFWVACLHAPFLQSTVTYRVGHEYNLFKVLFGLVWMVGCQLPFALLTLAGVIACCKRRFLWILAPATFMAAAYIFSRFDPEGIGRFLGGFWYTDYRRLGTCCEFLLIPIAAFGLGTLIERAEESRKRLFSQNRVRIVGAYAAVAIVFAVSLTLSFSVNVQGRTFDFGFGSFAEAIYNGYNPEVDHMYAKNEVDFVDKVREAIGPDELVINQPNDGSVFSHAVNDVNTYYRRCGSGGQTPSGEAIHTKLCQYDSDSDVRTAIAEIGASYVLLLDYQVPYDEGTWLPQYRSPEAWKGIDSITDDTPGFEVVLAEDDMRLYRIVDQP